MNHAPGGGRWPLQPLLTYLRLTRTGSLAATASAPTSSTALTRSGSPTTRPTTGPSEPPCTPP